MSEMTELQQAIVHLGQTIDRGFARQSESLELLTDQIGRLTEDITEMRVTMREEFGELRSVVREGFSELKAITERQAATAERQAESIAQLVAVVDRLVPRG
jgi:methyl-accepting chemotaxis protein